VSINEPIKRLGVLNALLSGTSLIWTPSGRLLGRRDKAHGKDYYPTRLALLIVVFTLFGTAFFAQTPAVVGTRITTVPPGLNVEFTVDGQTYKTPVTLLWPPAASILCIPTRDRQRPPGTPGWWTAGGAPDGNSTAHGSRQRNLRRPLHCHGDPDITEVAGSFTVS